MKTAVGIVDLVQEQRFLLAGDDGRSLSFVLAHQARLEGSGLQALRARRSRVVVRYRDAPDLMAHVAHQVVVAKESNT